MHALFLNCKDVMCNHSRIVVAIVASAIFFLCWKMTRDTINGVVVGCLFYEIVLYCNAGNEVAILVCATLYVAGIVVIAFGVPASLLYLLYLARSRWSVKRSIKLVRAMARRVSPLAGIFFFLSLTGCGNDEETLITLIYIVYVAGWMVIILGSALIGWGMFVLIRKFVRFLRSAKE